MQKNPRRYTRAACEHREQTALHQKAIIETFQPHRFRNPVCLTLGYHLQVSAYAPISGYAMSAGVTLVECEATMRQYLRRISIASYGHKARKHDIRLAALVVHEQNHRGRFHSHVLLEPPKQFDGVRFQTILQNTWCALDLSLKGFAVQRASTGYPNNFIDLNPNVGATVRYLLKEESKPDYSLCIDLHNSNPSNPFYDHPMPGWRASSPIKPLLTLDRFF
jgi:hypothetical protein